MIGARLKRVDAADERRARAMHTVWTFAYMAMASHLGAHLVDVSGVAARSRHMVNFDDDHSRSDKPVRKCGSSCL